MFHFNVVPFGVKNGSAAIQRTCEKALGDCVGRNVEIYADNSDLNEVITVEETRLNQPFIKDIQVTLLENEGIFLPSLNSCRRIGFQLTKNWQSKFKM